MSDNNIDVTNTRGDQDYGQNVHWHIVSGMVADLVGDCERRRREHEMGQDSHPAFGEHEIGKNRKYEANDGDKIIYSIHFNGPTLSADRDRHISRFPMLDCKPEILSKPSLRRLSGEESSPLRDKLNGSETLCPRMQSSALPISRSGGASGAARAAKRVLDQKANDDEDTIEKEEEDEGEHPQR